MSNDYDDPQLGDIVDEKVSRTYREIADERAPASLNERVLRDARSHAKGGYSSAVRWLRPMAWAATVGLSLAIVIQLTTLPGVEPPAAPIPRSLPESDAAGRVDEIAPDKLDRRVAPAVAEPAADGPRRTAPAAASGSDAFAITDAPLLDQARDMAVERTATEREAGAAAAAAPKEERPDGRLEAEQTPGPGGAAEVNRAADTDARVRARQMPGDSAFASTAVVEKPAATESFCDEAARAAPETWFDCVEQLRQAGREEDADAEFERLTETFPGFETR